MKPIRPFAGATEETLTLVSQGGIYGNRVPANKTARSYWGALRIEDHLASDFKAKNSSPSSNAYKNLFNQSVECHRWCAQALLVGFQLSVATVTVDPQANLIFCTLKHIN